MTYRTVIVPYNIASKGARDLVKASEGAFILRNKNKYKNISTDRVVLWGNVQPFSSLTYNKNSFICVNKIKFFKFCHDESWCPAFTCDPKTAQEWVDKGLKVVGRKTVTGTGGDGIVIFSEGSKIEALPLYTKYINKAAEYRVHVVKGKVIKVQRKIMPKDKKPVNGWEVRSHDNGFIFQSVDALSVPKKVLDSALECVHHLGLDGQLFQLLQHIPLPTAVAFRYGIFAGSEAIRHTSSSSAHTDQGLCLGLRWKQASIAPRTHSSRSHEHSWLREFSGIGRKPSQPPCKE